MYSRAVTTQIFHKYLKVSENSSILLLKWFSCGYYSRAASISILKMNQKVRLLFKGGLYLRAVSNWDFTVGYAISYLLQKHHTNIIKVVPCVISFYLLVNSIVLLLRKLQILVRCILHPTVSYLFQAVRLYNIYVVRSTYYLHYKFVQAHSFLPLLQKWQSFSKNFKNHTFLMTANFAKALLIKMEKMKV